MAISLLSFSALCWLRGELIQLTSVSSIYVVNFSVKDLLTPKDKGLVRGIRRMISKC